MTTDLVAQFSALWKTGGSSPDVFAFLNQHHDVDVADLLSVLNCDQQYRWKTDKPFIVEDYLQQLPQLAADSDCRVELVVGEFQARQNSKSPAHLEEFMSRFSDLSDTLRGKLSGVSTKGNLKKNFPQNAPTTKVMDSSVMQKKFGRYWLIKVLGTGSYGRVWLGDDDQLQRKVAIKVPVQEQFQSAEDAESYLAEARMVAGLDHPHIVPVYDMGRTEEGTIYVVSKYIQGCTLLELIKNDRPNPEQAAQLLAVVAQALHYAHQKRLVHRDIKPANLLIEEATGAPHVADFGLAIKEEDYLKSGVSPGTPAYMSPEQARAEGHRLDGRSDIFSLGIVFYELLTGKRPFRGNSHLELMNQIVSTEPKPPSELNPTLPAELERICLKALSKRLTERYATAEEFAEDLLHWNLTPQQVRLEIPINPKGLRSFDADDADYFLDLLPGPRNRNGLPESVAFWKSRIEQTDPDQTFSVGMIYGPSGSGKSSLVHAGLLPRLSGVLCVSIEATPDDTESRILRGLRKRLPDLPADLGLVETFTWLRRRDGNKVVIVLDQFEQWLHAHRMEGETELVTALRQCDGGQLQTVILVRDDFWLAAIRFMKHLEIPLVQGQNIALVDLFDVEHAKKVLIKFGQAFGKLPLQSEDFSEEEHAFLTAVADGLAQDGRVISVRLALFAEMIKGKPWVPATLEAVGGTEGVGINFLEETFATRTANPEHRLHQTATREVLKCLLPEVGTDIKGHMRSNAELLEASGYKNRPKDYAELLRILDGELRLITPTDPEGFESDSTNDLSSKYYQLTHDYLVPSLREWLTRKQRETKKGRAELRLAERAVFWSALPETRHLPSFLEWANIRSLTNPEKWTDTERKMMKQAGWFHGIRSIVLMGLVCILAFAGWHIRGQVVEASNEEKAKGLVNALVNAEIHQVPRIIEDLEDYRQWVDPKLVEGLEKYADHSQQRLNIGLALLPSDKSQLDDLTNRLIHAKPEQVETLCLLLSGYQAELVPTLWRSAEQPSQVEKPQLLQIASALATYDPDNVRKWGIISDRVVNALVDENSLRVSVWIKTLRPARQHLAKPLGVVFRGQSPSLSQSQIELATDILEDYVAEDLKTLTDLLLDAQPWQFLALFDEFRAHGKHALAALDQELARRPKENQSEDEKEFLARRQANAAAAALQLGKADQVWPLLKHSPDPRLRAWIIHRLQPNGAAPNSIIQRIKKESEVSIRRALILTLGEYQDLLEEDREPLVTMFLDWYKTDPDAGIHGATEWVLRRWGQEKKLDAIDRELAQSEDQLLADLKPKQEWYINTQGQTFVILQADEFYMGSLILPRPKEGDDEQLHKRKIGRRIAIATKEVTKAQWRVFSKANPNVVDADTLHLLKYVQTDDSPMTEMTWYEAAFYCNWLSEQEGISQDQWCYEPNQKGEYAEGMKAKKKFWELKGYRLPTESEWEFACRAGTMTTRYFGHSEDLLTEYAWFRTNAQNRVWPVASLKPNDFGLFDMQGNAVEWCQDVYVDDLTKLPSDTIDAGEIHLNTHMVWRGGGFPYPSSYMRSANRYHNVPNTKNFIYSFRPIRTYHETR